MSYSPSFYVNKSSKVDYHFFMARMEDQGSLGACAPYAATSEMESVAARHHSPIDQLSPLGAYNEILSQQGQAGQDLGSQHPVLLNVFTTVGVGKEATQNSFNVAPTAQYLAEAAVMKITSYKEIAVQTMDVFQKIDAIKGALAEHKSVLISFDLQEYVMKLHGSIETQEATLISEAHGAETASYGGHKVRVIGYDDAIGHGSFIIQNQWGFVSSIATTWGDTGSIGALSYMWAEQITIATIIDGITGVDATHTLQDAKVGQLYNALFDRAADAGGNAYWTESFTNGGSDVIQLANVLASYVGGTDSHFVSTVYENAMNRVADSSGLDYWTGKLAAGESRGALTVEIMDAVFNYTGSDALAISGRETAENRLNVSINLTKDQNCTDVNVCTVALVGVTDNANTVDYAINYAAGLLA